MDLDATITSNKEIHPFVFQNEPLLLSSILEKRLPYSANMWNMLQSRSKVPNINFYTINPDINDNTWIVATFYREDYGLDISISASPEAPITEEIKVIFATSNLIDWRESYCFYAVEKRISAMIYDISTKIKRNSTDLVPCILFHLGIPESLKLNSQFGSSSRMENIETKPLEAGDGIPFMLKTWKFAKENSDIAIKNMIANNPSMGVYVDGKLACGVLTQGSGILSMLYTLEEHRQKGFAKICMSSIMKELAKQGRIPCLTVETDNHISIAFQKKLGFIESGYVDFVMYRKSAL